MPKARAWRNTGKTKKRTHGAATLLQTAMPTKERLEHATSQDGATAFEIGGSGSRKVVRMLDAPLEQMRARAQLTETQYQTLARFRMHWFLGHQAGSLRGVDLDRMLLHGGGSRFQGEVAGEKEIWDRKVVEVAFGVLRPIERLVMALVVLQERGVNEVGAGLGYQSPYRGRQAVLECLRDAAQKIMSAWLTMVRD